MWFSWVPPASYAVSGLPIRLNRACKRAFYQRQSADETPSSHFSFFVVYKQVDYI